MGTQPDKLDAKRFAAQAITNANDICTHLKELERSGHGVAGRWIWELLQNARDVAFGDQQQTISFEITAERLTYSHHGRGFTEDEVIRLIDHGTTKLNDEDAAGKFGTGFMSTHLISRIVTISGPLDGNRYFEFKLSREGDNGDQMYQSLDESWKRFKDSIRPNHDGVVASTFSYVFGTGKHEATKEGLRNAMKFLPLVLALNKEFKRIDVRIDGVETSLDTYTETLIRDRYTSETNYEITINEGDDEPTKERYVIARKRFSFEEKGLTIVSWDQVDLQGLEVIIEVAVELDPLGITKRDQDFPVFFLYFPLVTTEKFGLPCVISSRQFSPRKERDGLPLLEGANKKDVELNQLIIEEGLGLFSEIVESIGTRENGGILSAFDFGACPDLQDLDQNWFKTVVAKTLKTLSGLKLLGSSICNEPASLEDLWMPVEEDSKLNSLVWNIAYHIDGIVLPDHSAIDYLKTIILDRPDLFNDEFWGGKNQKLTLATIAKMVDVPPNDLDTLAGRLRDCDEDGAIAWLQQLATACVESEQEFLLSRNRILPTQDRKLAKMEPSQLEIDGVCDEELLDLYKAIFKSDLRERLLRRDFKVPDGKLRVAEKADILMKIIAQAKTDALKYRGDAFDSNPINRLLSWIIENQEWDLLNGFPFYTKSEKEINAVIHWKADETLIGPISLWDEGWDAFVDLFPEETIVRDEYERIAKGVETSFEEKGIWKTKFVTRENLKLSTVEVKRLATIIEESENSHDIELSNAANVLFFEYPAEKSMVEKARQSKKRTGLLIDLIFSKLLQIDAPWDTIASLLCSCGEFHEVPLSRILFKLKTVQWANLNQEANLPSVDNFLPHFVDRKPLENALGNNRATAFLNRIGVSPSELLKRIKTRSNPLLESQWEGTMMAMMRSNHDPLALRDAISDPNFVNEFRDRQKLQNRIRDNQILGTAVEDLFKEALEAYDWSISKVVTIRTPYGSDFTLVDEADRIGEFEFTAGATRLIVEIKATGTGWASMTPLQAQTARDHPDNYVLVVFPLNHEALNIQHFKKDAQFVREIGKTLKGKVDGYEAFSAMSTIDDDLWLDTQGGQVRFKVGPKIWGKGYYFNQFIEWVKGILSKELRS